MLDGIVTERSGQGLLVAKHGTNWERERGIFNRSSPFADTSAEKLSAIHTTLG
jgi:hypothetical protein